MICHSVGSEPRKDDFTQSEQALKSKQQQIMVGTFNHFRRHFETLPANVTVSQFTQKVV